MSSDSSQLKVTKAWRHRLIVSLLVVGLALLFGSQLLGVKKNATKSSLLGRPDALLNFKEFNSRLDTLANDVQFTNVELSRRLFLFTSNLIQVGQHNSWALSRDISTEPVYFIGQSPFGAYLTVREQGQILARGREALVELLATGQDLPVSEPADIPGPDLEKDSLGLSRWFKRVTNSASYFDIPDFPLNEQPNPDKVTHIDADLRSCTGKIKNQHRCGSCYAFSFVSLAEWHLCRQTNDQLADLSEQYIVDCGHKTKLNGCKEGRLSFVREFVQFFGMKYEHNQKYVAHENKCTKEMLQENILRVKIYDWRRIKIEREVFEKTLEEQPIVLEVHLPSDVMSYSRGVHPGHNCNEKFGHGMLLVGHGRQDGVPYWLLRNSMGKKWGENGYLRVSRDMPEMNKCFRSGFVGKFKFNHVSEDNYVQLYDSMRYQPPEEVFEKKQNSKLPSLLQGL